MTVIYFYKYPKVPQVLQITQRSFY